MILYDIAGLWGRHHAGAYFMGEPPFSTGPAFLEGYLSGPSSDIPHSAGMLQTDLYGHDRSPIENEGIPLLTNDSSWVFHVCDRFVNGMIFHHIRAPRN